MTDATVSPADIKGATSAKASAKPALDDLPTFTPPNFTIKEILNAIPAHCFERSALRSTSYVVMDFMMIGTWAYLATYIDTVFGSEGTIVNGTNGVMAKWAAWLAYWVVMGWNFTGVWILGHECGHQAFSTSKAFNNVMGLFLHSFVLVPYHSWKISHGKHHAATGHADRDEVFVPRTRSRKLFTGEMKPRQSSTGDKIDQLLEDAPIYRLYHLLVQQLFGWPAYLFNNASGQLWYPKWTHHFDPSSLIFDKRHRSEVIISNIGLLAMVGLLTMFGMRFGLAAFVKYYFIPYLEVNHWLVMITYLQHTDPMVPHYRAEEWSFQRGALCTIDRKMLGPVGPYLMHGICETHVAHHINSHIPHYHAWEATECLKKFLGEYYNATDENMFVSLWKNFKLCRFVEDDGDIIFYKDAYGRAYRRPVVDQPSDSGIDVL